MLKIRIKGKTNVLRNISKATRLIGYRADRGIERVAETAQSLMVNYAPVKTGALKSGIEVWNVSTLSYSKFSYVVVSLVNYSAWITFGRTCPVKEFLPYGKTGIPDFSKSRYTGSQYMQKAFTEIHNLGMEIFRREFSR